MRISTFQSYLIWFLSIITLIIFSTTLPDALEIYKNRILFTVAKYLLILSLLLYSLLLAEDLRDIINIKYKIINEDGLYEIKYLTLFWLFIPYWKMVDEDSIYNSEGKAIKVVNKHKEEIRENRKEFFKRPDKSNKSVKYL